MESSIHSVQKKPDKIHCLTESVWTVQKETIEESAMIIFLNLCTKQFYASRNGLILSEGTVRFQNQPWKKTVPQNNRSLTGASKDQLTVQRVPAPN